MLLDYKAKFSESQALTATASSTNVYDEGAAANLAASRVKGILFLTAKGGTAPTIKVEIKGADDEAITSNVIVVGVLDTLTDPTITDGPWDIPIRQHAPKRYYRVTYTLAGTNPTFTAICGLTDGNFQTQLKTLT